MDELPALMTVDELQRYLRVSRTTVYAMVNRGDVPVVRIGRRRIRIPKDALVRQLAKTMQSPEMRGAGLTGPKPLADNDIDAEGTKTV